MRIFNQEKAIELNESEIDLSKGYLIIDKLFVMHHEAIAPKTIKSASKIAEELKAEGKEVNLRYDGKLYVTTFADENAGNEEVPIEDIVEEGKAAYDEYENIQVYIPYTEKELKTQSIYKLKAELAKIKEDIEQETFGLVRGDYAEKKAKAAEIINELRVLEGKEPREVKL